MRRSIAAVILAVATSPAFSAKIEPRSPWIGYWDFTGRSNPSDFMASLGSNRRHIYNRSISTLWDGAYVQGGAEAAFHPAFGRFGLTTEWKPLKHFKLGGRYDVYGFFGTNAGLLSFATSGTAFGRDGRSLRSTREQSETAQRIQLAPELRGRWGRIIAVNEGRFSWFRFNGDGPFFLELENDTLVQGNDLIISDQTDLLFELDKNSDGGGLWAGVFHSFTSPQSNFLERHRLGAVIEWKPARRSWGLDRPRFHGRAGSDIKDRNRQKQFFVEVGIGAEFDFYK